MPKPVYVSGKKELIETIGRNYDNKIVFMFTAKWCGPCKKMKGLLESEWSDNNPNVSVLYVDIDDTENEDILCDFEVESVPTFVINKIDNGKLVKLHTFSGADMGMLEQLLNK